MATLQELYLSARFHLVVREILYVKLRRNIPINYRTVPLLYWKQVLGFLKYHLFPCNINENTITMMEFAAFEW
jgi:hypothetical protein